MSPSSQKQLAKKMSCCCLTEQVSISSFSPVLCRPHWCPGNRTFLPRPDRSARPHAGGKGRPEACGQVLLKGLSWGTRVAQQWSTWERAPRRAAWTVAASQLASPAPVPLTHTLLEAPARQHLRISSRVSVRELPSRKQNPPAQGRSHVGPLHWERGVLAGMLLKRPRRPRACRCQSATSRLPEASI